MPLVRLQVRNEYGLGRPELYEETNREDPKAVLDGVAVAGLVGILRQLGDLADFAAEVFHGLQEQVLTTASRSHKLMLRAQNIEASLPPLEKAILAQTSHIHFAYTAGCEWHCRTKTEQNHFIYNELPQFIMDSYEDCRDPPCLHLLDKFDTGGPGSCLRRYSDPTFFKRVSAYSDEAYTEKIDRARKTRRSKKKRLSRMSEEILQGERVHNNSGRMQFASHVNGQTSSSQTASKIDVMLKSDLEDHSYSFDSRADDGYIECVFQPSNSVQLDEQEYKESPSSRLTQKTDTLHLASPAIDYNFSHDSFDKQIASTSTGLTWDEKEEIVASKSQPCERDETPEVLDETQNLDMHENEAVTPANTDHSDFLYGEESNLKPVTSRVQTDEVDSEPDNYLDAFNTIESESENDLDCERKREVEQVTSHFTCEIMENGVGATFTVLDHDLYDVTSQTLSSVSFNKETGWDFPETLREIPPLISERHVTSLRSPVQSDVSVNIERTKILADSHDSGSPIHELVPDICGNSVLDCSVGTNPLNDACSLNDIVSASIETVPSDVPFNIDRTKNFADPHASESPIHEQEPHICGNSILDCSIGTNPLGDAHTRDDAVSASIETVPSNVPVNRGGTENLADSLASENPICEQVPHIRGNFLLDCSVCTNPLGNAHTLNDTMSASIETVPPDVFVNLGRTRNLADSHVSESPIHEQEPHICGNSVLDCSMGTNPLGDAHTLLDAVSASIETVPSNVPVNRRRTENLADSFASENPIHEQVPHIVPHICESSVLDCSVGTDPLGNAHTLNDTVSASIETVPPDFFAKLGRTKNLADSYVSESPIHEQEPHICGNSVLDCSIGTTPLGDAHTLDDALSATIETVPSNVPVNQRRTEDLADSLASENPICERVPHICGNSVLDCSVGTNASGNVHTLNDTVTASSETVPPDVFVNLGRTKNLADSHASESHICEQVPHICGNSVLECSIGTNPLGDAHTLNDSVSAPIETVPLDAPVNSERTKNLADSHASEGTIHEQLPRICGNSVLNCSGGTNPLGDAQALNDKVSASNETDMSSGSKSSDLPDNEADRINSNICKSKEIPSESASDPSVGLWTNGGLLGLEPSKPPDFVMSSSLNQGSMTSINETDGVLNHNSMLKSNGYGEEQDLSAEIAELNQKEPSSRSLISHCDDQACISGKTSDCHQLSSGCSQNDEENLDENRVLAPGTVLPVAQDAKTACTEPNKESGLNSPLMFGLSHKLLLNSFCRKVSFDEKSGPDNSWKTGILEQGGQNSIVHQSLPETTCKEQVSYGYPICSPPPSPPLEHMKISFRPINGFETFKLKLKFPDGSNHRESTRDMFPSFRLVPEPSIPLHDSGSNSDDDDTFCRSSPFVSDDCLSPHSDYNSDQWESDDTPDISDHGVYNSSHRISLTESKSSSQEIIGVTNAGINLDNGLSMYTQYSVEPSLSGHLLDFPSFDTVNPALEKECDRHSDYNNNLKLQGHVEPIPPAPPLPPKQGWHSNLQLGMVNEKQICISKDTEQINDPDISESTLQLRPALVGQNLTDHEHHEFYDDFSCKSKDKLNQQNMNEQKKENQVGIGKDTDGKDFLHQIRTKSFNLKHTITGMPNAITSPTTTDKVTAILEKANAIRQVVASDDGEDDDSWSDI